MLGLMILSFFIVKQFIQPGFVLHIVQRMLKQRIICFHLLSEIIDKLALAMVFFSGPNQKA
jgi:hypothetical protein